MDCKTVSRLFVIERRGRIRALNIQILGFSVQYIIFLTTTPRQTSQKSCYVFFFPYKIIMIALEETSKHSSWNLLGPKRVSSSEDNLLM